MPGSARAAGSSGEGVREDLAEFYRLSMAAMAEPLTAAGLLTAAEAAGLIARLGEPDFLGCGFAFIGAWGRRAGPPPPR